MTDKGLGVLVGGVHVHALNHPDGIGVVDHVHVQVGGPDKLVKTIIIKSKLFTYSITHMISIG